MQVVTNPLEIYIYDKMDYFAEESKRLGTKKPLENFKAIIDSFILIQSFLGGLRHEEALHTLKVQFKLIWKDIKWSIKHTWCRFWHFRALASDDEKRMLQQQKEAVVHRKEFDESLEELRIIDEKLAVQSENLYKQLEQIDAIDLSFSSRWRMLSWTGLYVDLQLLAIYMRYMGGRIWVFLQFHAFILLVPILVFGIGYSFASKTAIELTLSLLSPSLLWMGVVLLIGTVVLKKYVIDKKLKALQKGVEKRLFLKLNIHLMIARTTALQVHTINERRRHKSISGDIEHDA